MKTFKGYISEARIYEPKYKAGAEFTLNERKPNAVHKVLNNRNYPAGSSFKKSDKEPTIEVNTQEKTSWVSVVIEDEKGQILRVWGSENAFSTAFNTGASSGGGKMYAADWEEVITIAHNMGGTESSGPDINKAAEMGGIKLPIKQKIITKINTPNLAFDILAGANLPSDTMIHFGRKTGSPSALWTKTFEDVGIKMNSKTMTPKTDMMCGKLNISLKKSGGSQLMSGYKGDTLGVIMAAYNKAIEEGGLEQEVKVLKADLALMYNDIETNFKATMDVGGGSREVRAKVKKGEILDKVETAVWATVQRGEHVQETIRGILERSPRVKYYAVEEAMTGNMKFSDLPPRSNYLMVFNDSPAGSHMDKINSSIINEYVGKVTWSVGLKSAKRRGALSFRAIIADEYEPTLTMKHIISEAWDELGEDRIYLSEGIWSKMKDKASSVVDWAKEKGLKVLKMLWNKIVSKIIALILKGWVWIKKIFGWQPTLTSISNPYFV